MATSRQQALLSDALVGTSETTNPARSQALSGMLFSRDEMNLAEFPLTVLSSRANPKVKTLEFTDSQRLKNGEVIERKWIITGADKFGLPTSTDDDVLLGLMRLTMDQGFRNRKIYFTRYELLKALRWSTEGRSYGRLTKSLDRLSGARVRASNAFFDNNSKAYQTRNFGIIDAYEINDSRGKGQKSSEEAQKSYFIWSEVLFDSFQAGFIKKLDLELYFSLGSAVSRRLYRYLDKHFYYRSTLERQVLPLAFEKLGLSRNYKYVSSVRQHLEPAAEELVKKGFLSSFEFSGRGASATVRFMANRGGGQIPRQSTFVEQADAKRSNKNPATEIPRTEAPTSPRTEGLPQFRARLVEALLGRGLNTGQALFLLGERSPAELQQVEQIIKYYDSLLKAGDGKLSRNPIGFLYRAVEHPLRFVLPPEFAPRAQKSQQNYEERRNPLGRPELRIIRAA